MSTNAQRYALNIIPHHLSLNGYFNWINDECAIYGLVTGSAVWDWNFRPWPDTYVSTF